MPGATRLLGFLPTLSRRRECCFELQADGVNRCGASGWLIVVGTIWIEEILKENLDAVANVHAQNDGTRAFVLFQSHVSGNEPGRRLGFHVAPQCVDHSRWIDGA